MSSEGALAELTTAPTAIEAEWIVGALKATGVSAVVFGGELSDEFAMSQKLLGVGVRVMVRVEELERARQALAAIRRAHPA